MSLFSGVMDMSPFILSSLPRLESEKSASMAPTVFPADASSWMMLLETIDLPTPPFRLQLQHRTIRPPLFLYEKTLGCECFQLLASRACLGWCW
jgi:hypothetical protein